LLVGVVLGAALLLLALPSRSESMVALFWFLQTVYVLLAAGGLWRSSKNAKSRRGLLAARVAAVAVPLGQLWLIASLLAPAIPVQI